MMRRHAASEAVSTSPRVFGGLLTWTFSSLEAWLPVTLLALILGWLPVAWLLAQLA